MKVPADADSAAQYARIRSSEREAEVLQAEVERLASRIEQLADLTDRPSRHALSFLRMLLKKRRGQLQELNPGVH